MCLPGFIDYEGNELPWLLGSAEKWQNGGAYIFRTSDTDLHIIPPNALSVTVHETDLVSEVHATFGSDTQPMIAQITRLVKGKDYVEVEYVVKPIPIADGIGKEIVSRFSTNIQSGNTFFTDSNGREFIERKRGDNKLYGPVEPDPVASEPISANYYPVNTALYIEDNTRSFSVLVDRSQGGSSLNDGSVELMIQRRLLADDARGCAEPLNETDIGITPSPPYGNATRIGQGIAIKGYHRLMVAQGRSGATKARSRMDEIFSQPHVFASSEPHAQDISFQRISFSALKSSLPENVMVVTYAQRTDGSYLIRLAHQYGPVESTEHSAPVEIDLSILFPSKTITYFNEKTLSGNQNRIDWDKKRLHWSDANKQFVESNSFKADSRNLEEVTSTIVLKPLEIRTFEVVVE